MNELYPYQEVGRKWLAQKRHALLADEMGLGKSAQAITACDTLGAQSILVLGPAVARDTWADEFDKFSIYDRPKAIIETGKDEPTAPGVTICSFDLASKDPIRSKLNALEWDVVVVDESHFIKSIKAERTKAVLGRTGFIHRTQRLWLLSGTPAPNNYSELWPMLHVFGAYPYKEESFIRRFCTGYETDYGFKITGGKNVEKLRELLAPIMLRRRKKDVLPDLPPIRFEHIRITQGEVDEKVYFPNLIRFPHHRVFIKEQATAVRAVLKHATGNDAKMAGLGSLIGTTSEYRRYAGLAKVPAAKELVDMWMEGGLKKLVIFAYHRDVIMELRDQLKKYNPVILFGGTDPARRRRNIKRFTEMEKYKIFIGQVQAAGTNITLTNAHTVLMVEPSWVPAENAQAIMRVHRIGQTMPVDVRFLYMKDTVDTEIQKVLKAKTLALTALFDPEEKAEENT